MCPLWLKPYSLTERGKHSGQPVVSVKVGANSIA